ncbi:hypothetical protein FOFC_15775 [Fusarium oxysporum]|nr:hypothetical protein FOFC_15775 [Fusarium oxysporum]
MTAEGYPLQESVLLDSGATLHIFRDTKRMKSLRAAPIGDFLWSGTTQVPIDGYGEARIILKSGDGSPTYLTLYNVALWASESRETLLKDPRGLLRLTAMPVAQRKLTGLSAEHREKLQQEQGRETASQ